MIVFITKDLTVKDLTLTLELQVGHRSLSLMFSEISNGFLSSLE